MYLRGSSKSPEDDDPKRPTKLSHFGTGQAVDIFQGVPDFEPQTCSAEAMQASGKTLFNLPSFRLVKQSKFRPQRGHYESINGKDNQ